MIPLFTIPLGWLTLLLCFAAIGIIRAVQPRRPKAIKRCPYCGEPKPERIGESEYVCHYCMNIYII
ncbi:MAG: hypothetical protein WC401_03570 [Bacteroidales bacterium]